MQEKGNNSIRVQSRKREITAVKHRRHSSAYLLARLDRASNSNAPTSHWLCVNLFLLRRGCSVQLQIQFRFAIIEGSVALNLC